MSLDDDYLFILILIVIGICLNKDVGWLELTLMYVGRVLALLNGLYELSFKLRVTSKKINYF